MDFSLNDEEQAIYDLATQILGDKSTHDRLRQIQADGDRVDAEAWAALAEAGVLGAAIPEAHGGIGLGFLATAMAVQVVGSTASPVPLLSTAARPQQRPSCAAIVESADGLLLRRWPPICPLGMAKC